MCSIQTYCQSKCLSKNTYSSLRDSGVEFKSIFDVLQR